MNNFKFKVFNKLTQAYIDTSFMSMFMELRNKEENQFSCEEFQVIPAGDNFQLYTATGRLDINKKDIFVGDIVVAKSYPFYRDYGELNYIGEVCYWEEETIYYLKYHRVSDRVSGNVIDPHMSEFKYLEIVGNINEKSDLKSKLVSLGCDNIFLNNVFSN